uniref:Large ribosomal subunit protein uL4m n=1 Tax=Leucocytozoon caulleryi TaxID=211597 RepID=U3TTZ0_LEUCU|nr:large subunit ribosomal protein 4 [Leucocytozoon caulleryi]BAN94667.1 large subunit ribosomal protein 4 [Leucocytozoon caulleryi]
MYIIILNINNIFNIAFKYKYSFFIKLYLNNYIKIYKLLTYLIRHYLIYKKNITKHTKHRSLIHTSNKKIRVQKGLGKARLKNISSPICKQGACVFGPFFVNNVIMYNGLTYQLIYVYLLINKRSNIIILKYEYLIKYLYFFLSFKIMNLMDLINKILYFKGIVSNKKNIIFFGNYINKYLNKDLFKMYNFNQKYIIMSLILCNYIIFII